MRRSYSTWKRNDGTFVAVPSGDNPAEVRYERQMYYGKNGPPLPARMIPPEYVDWIPNKVRVRVDCETEAGSGIIESLCRDGYRPGKIVEYDHSIGTWYEQEYYIPWLKLHSELFILAGFVIFCIIYVLINWR